MSVDLGSQHLPMQAKQSTNGTPKESISKNLGSQQLPVSNDRMTQMLPNISNPGSQQNPNQNKRTTQMVSIPKSLGSQMSPLPSKRMTIAEPIRTTLGSQQSSTPNKRNAQIEPSPKGQAESCESVRAKLRESLADSLALVCKQQNQATGNTSQDVAVSTFRLGDENPLLSETTTRSTYVSSHMPEDASKGNSCCQNATSSQSSSQDVLAKDNKGDAAPNLNPDGQVFQFNYLLDEDVPFGNSFFAKDELLQGNGLCWVSDLEVQDAQAEETHSAKRPKLVHEVDGNQKSQPSPQSLATRIEAELFKLYGGVNKKYKEKGRSLLFNLKDRNNPELRVRVMSGDIAPERLCSMTAEELASKELSEWRIAKAEEFAQMVVLPDSDVDVRRLVKKTHKGEFQVEFEQDDGSTVEVAAGDNSLSQFRQKNTEKGAGDAPKSAENLSSEDGMKEKVNSDNQNRQSSLTTLPDDGSDLMQGLMVDELKDTDLPPIVSLDEFMESLDSEPPFENLPIDPGKANPDSDQKNNSEVGSKLESSDIGSIITVENDPDEPEKAELKCTTMDTDLKFNHVNGEPGTSTDFSTPKQESESSYIHSLSEKSFDATPTKQEQIWEGLLQLNVSSVVTVIGNYKSGERTSAKEWTSFLDVKGRVRLDAFEKFLQEIPMSRSRAIMVVHFRWKEGSPESGRVNLLEVVESYVADERVGFAEPTTGVELYLCPPHGVVPAMLGKYIFKDHMETLNGINDGLIGIVVWRKAHVTSTASPNSSSHHHKHNARKQHSGSVRRQHEKATGPNNSKENPHPQNLLDEPIDDIPPGFGPAAVAAAQDEDDLPEFDFAGGSTSPVTQFSASNPPSKPISSPLQALPPPPSRPVDQMRELVHRYGGGGEMGSGGVEVDDDDDDIPEWLPQSLNQPPIAHPQQLLPPALTSPPPPPPRGPHFQQPSLPAQMINQSPHFPPVQQFLQFPPNQQPIQQMQTMNMMVTPPWQLSVGWPPVMVPPPPPPVHGNTGLFPNFGGQPPGAGFMGGGQNGGEWRFDVNNSNSRGRGRGRGF